MNDLPAYIADLGMEEAGLAEAIVAAVQAVHPHLHALLFSNVLLTGMRTKVWLYRNYLGFLFYYQKLQLVMLVSVFEGPFCLETWPLLQWKGFCHLFKAMRVFMEDNRQNTAREKVCIIVACPLILGAVTGNTLLWCGFKTCHKGDRDVGDISGIIWCFVILSPLPTWIIARVMHFQLLYSAGGSCRCPGFKERLFCEVRRLVPDDYEVSIGRHLDDLLFLYSIAARLVHLLPWTGCDDDFRCEAFIILCNMTTCA